MDETRKFPLTQSAYDRLKEELAHLEGEARTKTIQDIATARLHGDLSENAEYHAAKDQQGLQEARLRHVREMLEHAEIISADDDDVVAPGKLVTLRHEGEDPEIYLLGTREERGGGYDILTVESPLGRAILGRSVGERVTAQLPRGEASVEIVSVAAP